MPSIFVNNTLLNDKNKKIPANDEFIMQLPIIKIDKDNEEHHEYLNHSCVTCMSEYQHDDNIVKLACNHVYHHECITQWFKEDHVCPICRKPVEKKEIEIKKEDIKITNEIDEEIAVNRFMQLMEINRYSEEDLKKPKNLVPQIMEFDFSTTNLTDLFRTINEQQNNINNIMYNLDVEDAIRRSLS